MEAASKSRSSCLQIQEYAYCGLKCTLLGYIHAALKIRAGQRSITANFWPLAAHIYYVIDHGDPWHFQVILFYYYFQKQPYADVLQNWCY